jgi:hypothetical protein
MWRPIFSLARFRPQAHICKMAQSKPKVTFDALQKKGGRSWYVRATLAHGQQPHIDGFTKKAEALAWIERESADWLKRYEGGKYA